MYKPNNIVNGYILGEETSRLISVSLGRENIRHKTLYKAQDANNYSYTDGKNVWVKLARYPDSPDRQKLELSVARQMLDAGIVTVQPLLSEPLLVGDCWASVWLYVPNSSRILPQEWTPQLVQRIWAQVQMLHKFVPPHNIPQAGGLTEKVHRRIVDTNASVVVADQLLYLCDLVSKRWDAQILSAVENGTAVCCHGDLHVGNVLFSNSEPFLIDWESTVMAPPEWDIAGLRHNIVRIGGRVDVWDMMEKIISNYSQETIMLAEQVKAISGASYLLNFEDTLPILEQRLAALSKYVPQNMMPPRLDFYQ